LQQVEAARFSPGGIASRVYGKGFAFVMMSGVSPALFLYL
jgi:hypothetical protein